MSSVLVEFLLVLLLLVLNGVFAMSEIAVVSARKARLQQRAEQGSASARRALELANDPGRFLATVQVGITLVGILAGAFGGATLAEHVAVWLVNAGVSVKTSEPLSLGLVVLGITYLSLVVGELVPKRVGLNHPETIAAAVAGPMRLLSRIGSPLVTLLTWSTEGVVRLLRIRAPTDPPVTEAEISGLLEQGTRAGVFEEEEQELVERVFWLADQRVASVMIPRVDVVWIDAADAPDAQRRVMLSHPYQHFPVCEGSLDRVLGIVSVRDLWAAAAEGHPAEVNAHVRPAKVVPATAPALQVLQEMREAGEHLAVVVDEYGGTDGLVTLLNLMEEIVGDVRLGGAPADPEIVRREDGSYLVDGSVLMDEIREVLDLDERRAEDRQDYRTLGGFVFTRLGRVPRAGDRFESDGFTVEVVDMDRNRVDKVLVTPLRRADAEDEDREGEE